MRGSFGPLIAYLLAANPLDFHLCVEVDVDRRNAGTDRAVVEVRRAVALRKRRSRFVGGEVVDARAVVEVRRLPKFHLADVDKI
jgi:hypothetical protein